MTRTETMGAFWVMLSGAECRIFVPGFQLARFLGVVHQILIEMSIGI